MSSVTVDQLADQFGLGQYKSYLPPETLAKKIDRTKPMQPQLQQALGPSWGTVAPYLKPEHYQQLEGMREVSPEPLKVTSSPWTTKDQVGVTKRNPGFTGGTVDVGGQKFQFGSGGRGHEAIPYGTYNVDFNGVGPQGRSGWGGALPPAVAGLTTDKTGNTISGMGYTGRGIEIHAGSGDTLDQLYSQGCFAVARSQWPQFKEALLNQAKAAGGSLTLTVQPGQGDTSAIAKIAAANPPQPGSPVMNSSGEVFPPNPLQGGSSYLANERKWIADEIAQNPQLGSKLEQVVGHEQSPGYKTPIAEALFNRLNLLKQKDPNLTLASYLDRTGNNQFYGPVRKGSDPGGYAEPSFLASLDRPGTRQEINAALDGSNLVKGYQDQGGPGDPNYSRSQVFHNKEGFGNFGDEKTAEAYRQDQQAKASQPDDPEAQIKRANDEAAPKLIEASQRNEKVPEYDNLKAPYLALTSGKQQQAVPDAGPDPFANASPTSTPNALAQASANNVNQPPGPMGGNQGAVDLAMSNPDTGAPPMPPPVGAPSPGGNTIPGNTVPGTPMADTSPQPNKPGGLMDGLAKAMNVPAAAPQMAQANPFPIHQVPSALHPETMQRLASAFQMLQKLGLKNPLG